MASVSIQFVQLSCIDATSIEGVPENSVPRFSSMASSRSKPLSMHSDSHTSGPCPAPPPPMKHVATASVPPLPPSIQQTLSYRVIHKGEIKSTRLQSQSPPLSPAIHPFAIRSSCSLSPNTPPVPKFASNGITRQCGDFKVINRFAQSSNVTIEESTIPSPVPEPLKADESGNVKLDACVTTSPISKRKRSAEGVVNGSAVPPEDSISNVLAVSPKDVQHPGLPVVDADVRTANVSSGECDNNVYEATTSVALASPSSAKKLCSQHLFHTGSSCTAEAHDGRMDSPVSAMAAYNGGSGNAGGRAKISGLADSQRRSMISEHNHAVPMIPSSPVTMTMTPSDKYPRCVSQNKSPLQRSASCSIMTAMGPPASPRSPNQLRKSGSFGVTSSPRYVPLAPRIKASPPLTPSSVPIFHGSPVMPPVGQRAAKIFGLMGLNACASPSLTPRKSHFPANVAPLPPSPLLTKSQSYSVALSPGKSVLQLQKEVITRSLSDPRVILTKDALLPPSQAPVQEENRMLPSPGGWALQQSGSTSCSPLVSSQMASPFRQPRSPAAFPAQSPIYMAQQSPQPRTLPSTSSQGCYSSPMGSGLGWVDRLSDMAKQKVNAMSSSSHSLTPKRSTLNGEGQPPGYASPAGSLPQRFAAPELQSGCSPGTAVAAMADATKSHRMAMQSAPSPGQASPIISGPFAARSNTNLQPKQLPPRQFVLQAPDLHDTEQQQQQQRPYRQSSDQPQLQLHVQEQGLQQQQQQQQQQQHQQDQQDQLQAFSVSQEDMGSLQPAEGAHQTRKIQYYQHPRMSVHQPSMDYCHGRHYQREQQQLQHQHQQQDGQHCCTNQSFPQTEMDGNVGMKKSESVCDSSVTSGIPASAPLPRASTAPTTSHTTDYDRYTSSMLNQQNNIFQGATDPCSAPHAAGGGNFTNLMFGHGGMLTHDQLGSPARLTSDLDYSIAPATDDMDGATWTDTGLATVQELELQELEVLEWLPDNDIGGGGFFDHIDHGLVQGGLDGSFTLDGDVQRQQDAVEEALGLEQQQLANSAEVGADDAASDLEKTSAELESAAVENAVEWTAQGMPVIVEEEAAVTPDSTCDSENNGSALPATGGDGGQEESLSGSVKEQEEMASLKCTEDVQMWCPTEY